MAFSLIMFLLAVVLLSLGFWLKGKEAGRHEAMMADGRDGE